MIILFIDNKVTTMLFIIFISTRAIKTRIMSAAKSSLMIMTYDILEINA